MLELLTGAGLAASAGLNAYVPLLLIGVASRFTDLVALPAGWQWLENGWVQLVLVVLLIIEVIADKVPAVDSVNDIIQTVVRPASGGIVFGSGASSETVAVTDPEAFVSSGQWVPIVLGIVLALVVHLIKAGARPVANTMTAGIAAPLLSAAEDVGSVLLSVVAILLPVLVIVALGGIVVAAVVVVKGLRRLRRNRRQQKAGRGEPRPALPR